MKNAVELDLFYGAKNNDGKWSLEASELQHLLAFRKRIGDRIAVTDGHGLRATLEIDSLSKKNAQFQTVSEESQDYDETLPILVVAPTKQQSRMEWMVEKATEIGVSDFYFVTTEKSERKKLKTTRLVKKAISAMKQSGRCHLPAIHELQSLDDILKENWEDTQLFIASCDLSSEHKREVRLRSNKSLILIGPEGGFTSQEVLRAQKSGYQPISLGDYRLRTETAALTWVCRCNFGN